MNFTTLDMSEAAPLEFFSRHVNRGDYFVSNREVERDDGFEVVCAGWESCTEDYRIEREGFVYYALEFVVGGEWELVINDEVRKITVGSVFMYGPDVPYSLKAVGQGGWSKYFVDFRCSENDGLFWTDDLPIGGTALLLNHGWLRELFDQLIQVKELPLASQNGIADQIFKLMLARLPLQVSCGQHASPGWLSFERCRNYLRENYLTIGSLSDAARACGVAPAYLSRLFRKHSNETPKAFLDRLRMSFAAQKLLRGNLQVKQVAAESGYADVFHFSRVFKKTFGVSPSHFSRRSE